VAPLFPGDQGAGITENVGVQLRPKNIRRKGSSSSIL